MRRISTARLPLRKHVPNAAVILRENKLLNLFLGQPFEVFEIVCVGRQVSLTGHDATLQEEGPLPVYLLLRNFILLRVSKVVGVVSNWVVADQPRVHVDPDRVREGSFGGLITFRG
jgi:hypothetical protein